LSKRIWLAAASKSGHSAVGDQNRALRHFRLENMSRTPSNFRQTDVSRALKAIRVAGYSAARVLIGKDGRIEIITAAEGKAQAARGTPDDPDLDRELKDWEGRRGRQVRP
jgi:hypothetical protein